MVEDTPSRPLLKILGIGFGLAMAFGGTVGVGILRLPGSVAAALGDTRLITLAWLLGGLYAFLGACAVTELAVMFPEAGGFLVYARRSMGRGVGFAIGWSDWLNNVASLAYGSVTAATFLGALWSPANGHSKTVAITILVAFTALHWAGLRIGRTLAGVITIIVGVMLLVLVVGCFITPPVQADPLLPLPTSPLALPLLSLGFLSAIVTALRSVLVTFDGWYSPIYFAEESTNPTRSLPRAIIGGSLLVGGLYLIINLAFLRVLPLQLLANSSLPAADAARVVLPHGGAELVTLISLFTVLSLLNAVLLMTPRILYAIGRDGLFTRKATLVSASGTPRVALALSSAMVIVLILSGSFEQIVALAAVLFLLNYISAYVAVFILRWREPLHPRPYRAVGFPYTTAIVLLGSILFLIAAVIDDPRSGLIAGILMVLCVPLYLWLRTRSVTSSA